MSATWSGTTFVRMGMAAGAALALLAFAPACKMSRPPAMPASPSDSSADPKLAALADEYWQGYLRFDPVGATLMGDRRFDAEMPDPAPEATDRRIAALEALAARLGALDVAALGDRDRVTHAALAGEIESNLDVLRCGISDWAVDPRDGPQVGYLSLAQLQTVRAPEEGRALVARWQKMGTTLDAQGKNLVRALGEGRVATRESVERVLRQLDELLAKPTPEWVLGEPGRASHPDWSEADRQALRGGVAAAVETGIRPAFERYRTLLRKTILPKARDDAHPGLTHIPGGDACYQQLIGVHTSLSLPAEEIHHIGLEENARIRAEMLALGSELLGEKELSAIQERLRSDPKLFFTTRDEVERKAEEALRRAEAAMPKWFGVLPQTPCVVKRIEPFEEKDSTIAYYRQPSVDGTRPGTYYVNTYAPETRPRYEAEVLAFHESIPGHHLQIALAQEQAGIPEFRKHLGVTAYVEGWALYTERLSEEMGLYSGDLDRMGMLSFDAWRASRLVVDTGIHVKGWSRQQAIDYMMANTVLARNNVENEVDRYIGWPGQALAYKLGQREILALRALAERRLGDRFDVRGFHDTVLGLGAVSLKVLRAEVERWAKASLGR